MATLARIDDVQPDFRFEGFPLELVKSSDCGLLSSFKVNRGQVEKRRGGLLLWLWGTQAAERGNSGRRVPDPALMSNPGSGTSPHGGKLNMTDMRWDLKKAQGSRVNDNQRHRKSIYSGINDLGNPPNLNLPPLNKPYIFWKHMLPTHPTKVALSAQQNFKWTDFCTVFPPTVGFSQFFCDTLADCIVLPNKYYYIHHPPLWLWWPWWPSWLSGSGGPDGSVAMVTQIHQIHKIQIYDKCRIRTVYNSQSKNACETQSDHHSNSHFFQLVVL